MKGQQDSKNSLLVSSRQYFVEMVSSGLARRNVKTNPAAESYLVNLLEHYLDARNLFEEADDKSGSKPPTTLAEMYLKANNADIVVRKELLKKLADRSLYISGFFGDSLKRKTVDIDYYAGMGCAAYENLSYVIKEDTLSRIYKIFSKQFLEFVDVLSYISQHSFIKSDESVLRLYDLYMKTGSELAKEKLIEMGVVTISKDQIKFARQD